MTAIQTATPDPNGSPLLFAFVAGLFLVACLLAAVAQHYERRWPR